ncbi:MAG: isoprenylcysteine carboxylmethyltransferase family protein [Ignavibacteriales bacterium]|nr:isoprenylcysteine carboxylmethyltransferase family protein [Ignavibacteriales bacterium]
MSTKTKFAINAFLFSLFFSFILFLSAGSIDYLQGWIYLLTTVATTSLNILTIKADDELMKERAKPGEGTKSWDKALLGVSSLLYLAILVVAGLDSGRYRWSPEFHWSVNGTGVFLMVAGQIFFFAARNENRFFSSVVRIQKERGHTVCDIGIYKIVRHPGYLGMIISTAGIPLLLGSLWSSIPSFISIILLLARTLLEDNTLKNELEGYSEYMQRTRFKLVPRVW